MRNRLNSLSAEITRLVHALLRKRAFLIALMIVVLIATTVSEGQTQQPVNVMKIREQISRGEPVNYINSIIEGDINIRELNLPQDENGKFIITSPIKFEDCKFEGILDFTQTVFRKPIFLVRVIIYNNTTFDESEFYREVHFEKVYFLGSSSFKDVAFRSYAYFVGNRFNRSADFSHDIFKNADFSNTQFIGDVTLRYAIFAGDANFYTTRFFQVGNLQDITFKSGADFRYASFAGDTEFGGDKFEKYAYFDDSKFSNDSDFTGVQFIGNAYFGRAIFENDAYFWRSQFRDGANFKEAKFHKKANFKSSYFAKGATFENATIAGDAIFEGSHFLGKLYLTSLKFSHLFIEWDAIDQLVCNSGTTYRSLIQNFKELEQYDDALKCYYQYRKWTQTTKNLGWSKFTDIISWLSCGYGVRPSYPLIWGLVIIPLFGLIFWGTKSIKKSKCPYIPNKNEVVENASLWDALYFSTLVFLHTNPPPFWYADGRYKYLSLIEDVLGWFLLALFVVVLVNVTITW